MLYLRKRQAYLQVVGSIIHSFFFLIQNQLFSMYSFPESNIGNCQTLEIH